MKFEWTVQIARSPDDVYGYLADFSKHHEWSPKPLEIKALSEGPTEVGSKFHSSGWIPRKPHNENDVEVTTADAAKRLTFNAVEKGEVFVNDYVLTDEAGGTRVDRSLTTPELKGAMKLAFPIIGAVLVRPGGKKNMEMLKANLESAKQR